MYHTPIMNNRERSCAGEKFETNRAQGKSIQAAHTATTTLHTTASNNTIVGWNMYEYVGWLFLLLPQCVALNMTTRPAPARRGTGYLKGGGFLNFHPAGSVVSTCQSRIFWPRVDGAFL